MPVFAVGSIHSVERVQAMLAADVWRFTGGSALFERSFAVDLVRSQLDAILALEGVVA